MINIVGIFIIDFGNCTIIKLKLNLKLISFLNNSLQKEKHQVLWVCNFHSFLSLQ